VAASPLRRSPLWGGPGTYALVIALDRPRIIQIGRRRRFHFPVSFYLYVGSALGPGGLTARLARHLRACKRPHWHVDYLLQRARIVEVWGIQNALRRECDWAQAAMQLPGANIVSPRFGASDCRCASHLIALSTQPDRSLFAALTGDEVRRWAME